MSKTLRLILGDQLSLTLPILESAPENAVIALCEVGEEGRYVPHHPQKIAMMLAAMRHFAATLRQRGFQVHYSTLDDTDNTQQLIPEAERVAQLHGCDEIQVTLPGEWRLAEAIESRRKSRVAPRWRVLEDTRFFCSRQRFAQWMEGRKRPRMEDFYPRRYRQYAAIDPRGRASGPIEWV